MSINPGSKVQVPATALLEPRNRVTEAVFLSGLDFIEWVGLRMAGPCVSDASVTSLSERYILISSVAV